MMMAATATSLIRLRIERDGSVWYIIVYTRDASLHIQYQIYDSDLCIKMNSVVIFVLNCLTVPPRCSKLMPYGLLLYPEIHSLAIRHSFMQLLLLTPT